MRHEGFQSISRRVVNNYHHRSHIYEGIHVKKS